MTCIVAWEKDDGVYIGGDSAGLAGIDITIRDDPKVFTLGPYVFGFAQSFRMGQLLMTSFKPPKRKKKDVSDYQFMCTKFINEVRRCFFMGGFLHNHGDREEGGCFMVGYNGKLYTIDLDFQVGIPHDHFDSIGCGRDYALGVIKVCLDANILDPKEVLGRSLEAAGHFSGGVRPPYRIIFGGQKLELLPKVKRPKRKAKKKTKRAGKKRKR